MIQENIFYEMDKESNPDHVATPRYVVEDIYDLIEAGYVEKVEEE